MDTVLSHHAQKRLQQRGIAKKTLDLLLFYGNYQPDGHGAELVYFSRQSRSWLKRRLSRQEYAHAERHFGTYAVVAGNTLVTVGHRTSRIMR